MKWGAVTLPAWGVLLLVIASGAAGAVVGRMFPPFILDDGFWRQFLTSAGFGGTAAVVAAVIAYRAARRSAREAAHQATEDREERRAANRKEQWWARAEWALNQVATGDPRLGFDVLAALAESEWAEEHEADVIAAAAGDAVHADAVEDLDSRPGPGHNDHQRTEDPS